MAKLTNNSLGPKAIPTRDRGIVVLKPGQSADLDVHDYNLAAIEKHGLLDAPNSRRGSPSLADVQREIASQTVPLEGDAQPGDGTLPAQNDPEVQALVDDNDAKTLRQIADDEGVAYETDNNKPTIARKIVAARRAR